MIKSLLLYSVYRYGSISTRIITDMFVDEFPYMSGCNLAVLIPDDFFERQTLRKVYYQIL